MINKKKQTLRRGGQGAEKGRCEKRYQSRTTSNQTRGELGGGGGGGEVGNAGADEFFYTVAGGPGLTREPRAATGGGGGGGGCGFGIAHQHSKDDGDVQKSNAYNNDNASTGEVERKESWESER